MIPSVYHNVINHIIIQDYASKAHIPPLSKVIITAVSKPNKVTVNGKQVGFAYNTDSQSLIVTGLNIMMDATLSLIWA